MGTLVPPPESLDAQVWDIFKRVVESIGEIGCADCERQLDDLSVIVELAQFSHVWSANCSRTAGHAIGIKDRRFFLFIKERAAVVKGKRSNLLRSDFGGFRGGHMG